MADLVGINGLQNVSGTCDLCGEHCDAKTQHLNALDCSGSKFRTIHEAACNARSFKGCPSQVYHQECLEKFLKSLKLEKNRKSGYACPRGCGKRTRFEAPCPGKIEKSHPIISRASEGKKKKKPAPAPAPCSAASPAPSPAPKPAAPPSVMKIQIRSATGTTKEVHVSSSTPQKPRGMPSKVASASEPDARAKLLAAAAAARNELGLQSSTVASDRTPPSRATRAAASSSKCVAPSVPAASAWGTSKPLRVSSADKASADTLGALLTTSLVEKTASQQQAATKAQPASAWGAPPPAARRAPQSPPPLQEPAVAALPPRGPSAPAWGGAWRRGPPGSEPRREVSASGSREDASLFDAADDSAALPDGLLSRVSSVVPDPAWADPVARWLASELDAEALAYVCGAGAQSALHDKVQLAVDALIDSGALLCEPSCEGASDGPDRGVASEKSGSTVPVLEARLEDGPLTPSLTATPGCSTPRSTAPADLADSAPASARLTKSQRKNLRRAEKKRQKREASSVADDIEDVKEGPDREAAVSRGGLFQDGHGEAEEGETGVGTAWGADHGAFPAWAGAVSAPDVPVEAHLQAPTEAPCSSLGAVAGLEAAVAGAEAAAAVAGFKAAAHVRDLQLLAFTETQAVAAVRLFGSDLQAAVEWLLEVRIRGLGDPTALLLVAAGREAAEVDVSEEMAVMERAVHMGVPRGRVHEAVLAADGDVHAAVDSLLLDTPPLGGLAGEGWEADAGLGPGFDLGLGSGGSDLGAPLLRDVSCALECDLERLVGSLLVG